MIFSLRFTCYPSFGFHIGTKSLLLTGSTGAKAQVLFRFRVFYSLLGYVWFAVAGVIMFVVHVSSSIWIAVVVDLVIMWLCFKCRWCWLLLTSNICLNIAGLWVFAAYGVFGFGVGPHGSLVGLVFWFLYILVGFFLCLLLWDRHVCSLCNDGLFYCNNFHAFWRQKDDNVKKKMFLARKKCTKWT